MSSFPSFPSGTWECCLDRVAVCTKMQRIQECIPKRRLGTRKLMVSHLQAQGYTGVEFKKQIFLRTYRNDFSDEMLNKICEKIENMP